MKPSPAQIPVSVILLHSHGMAHPGPCLDSLVGSLGSEGEVLIVTVGEESHGQELRQEAGARGLNASIMCQPRAGAGAARNFAASQARGRILFFSQLDCVLPPGLCAGLAETFAQEDIEGLGGGCLPLNQGDALARLVGWELAYGRRQELEPDCLCAAYLRETFLDAGGFDPADDGEGLENYEFSGRLLADGARLRFDPELAVRRPLPASWGGYLRLAFHLGRNRFKNTLHRRRLGLDAGGTMAHHVQSVVVLFVVGLPVALWQHDEFKGLLWSAVCLLLLYPLNRRFLKYVAGKEPDLMNRALLMCLLRPWAWTAGLVKAALDRMGGTA